MPGYGPFQSNRRLRKQIAEREREKRALGPRLDRIRNLAREIRDERQLRQMLNQIPDDAQRAETLKLLEPYLMFSLSLPTLGDDPVEKQTAIVLTDDRGVASRG